MHPARFLVGRPVLQRRELAGHGTAGLALSVCLALSCQGAPTQGTPEPSSAIPATVVGGLTVHEVGQTATTAFYSMRVLHVTTCTVEPHLQPPAGVRRLGVEVAIEATTETKVPVNPFYALISDRNGERFEATLAGCAPVLAAAQISQGESARGWISFDVPQEMLGARLSYAPAVIGAGRPEVVFALDPGSR
jgi:Domain of unknown function (DUF4352)